MPPTFVETMGSEEAWASIKVTGVPSFLDVRHIISIPALTRSTSLIQEVK